METGRAADYSMNHLNYDDHVRFLLPRAVAYSAGLINYFFRGKMQISAPASGFYGIVDHSVFANANTNISAGFVGFNRIKLRLVNTTPDIVAPGNQTAAPQAMTSGKLVAVVKFRRNTCYDDLLTRWPTNSTAASGCRSVEEEIVVSDPHQFKAVQRANGPSDPGEEITFQFPTRQIPINAWDIRLQVVYRGVLGQEADAVVVATKDISEPSFYAFFNGTDQVVVGGAAYTPQDAVGDPIVRAKIEPGCLVTQNGQLTLDPACHLFSQSVSLTAGGVTIASDGPLTPGKFGRVAVLSDLDNPTQLSWTSNDFSCWVFASNPLVVEPYRAQFSSNLYVYDQPHPRRGTYSWKSDVCFKDIGTDPTPLETVRRLSFGELSGINLYPSKTLITGW